VGEKMTRGGQDSPTPLKLRVIPDPLYAIVEGREFHVNLRESGF
jgi:hypothetical protein